MKFDQRDLARELSNLWPVIQKHGVTGSSVFGSEAGGRKPEAGGRRPEAGGKQVGVERAGVLT